MKEIEHVLNTSHLSTGDLQEVLGRVQQVTLDKDEERKHTIENVVKKIVHVLNTRHFSAEDLREILLRAQQLIIDKKV